MRSCSRAVIYLSATLLVACSSVPIEQIEGEVRQALGERGRILPSDEARIRQRAAAGPLSAELAVELALVNNPELRLIYGELGSAGFEYFDADRIRNPALSLSRLEGGVEMTIGLVASIADLITRGVRHDLARSALAEVQAGVAGRVLDVAAQTELAFYRHCLSLQKAAATERRESLAVLTARLAERYFEAGNTTARQLADARTSAALAKLDAEDARADIARTRADLAVLMGLTSTDAWTIDMQLGLPTSPLLESLDLQALARSNRMDLVAANERVALFERADRAVRWQRFVGDVDLGFERKRESSGESLVGPSLDIDVPIAGHRASLGRADIALEVARAERDALLNSIDADVERASAAMMSAHRRATIYREELIPARQESRRRAQEEANFMLIGPFELLRLKEEEYGAQADYLKALLAFWTARSDLVRAVGTTLPLEGPIVEDNFRDPEPNGHHHREHP